MSMPKTYPQVMSLRLTLSMESGLESLAYQQRTSKAAMVRRLLARAIAESHRQEITNCNRQISGGVL